MTEREIFVEALTRPAAERPGFLDRACGPDAELRRRLNRLLALHAAEDPLLDAPAAELPATPPAADTPDRLLATLAPFLGPSPRPGALGRVGHYDLLEVLGRGGCGVVFRAFDDKLQRVVAVKVLAPHLAATNPPRQRFLREARAAARVQDDHVVQVYAVEEDPLPYLVMEFVGGGSLQDRLDRAGPLPAAEAARVGRQVALGLAAAHDRGLIHRDVKPANVLLDGGPEPRARLTDFGLARAADDASLTQSGVLAGTPLYMSPEQARGGEVLDPRADLFSLGSVLYTLVAGRPPFRAATPLAVLKRVAEDTPRPLREVVGDVPPPLVAVIDRLMAKAPAARYATARAAADALAGCIAGPPTPLPAPARRTARRVAAALLAAVALAAWAVSRPARPPADPAPPEIVADPPAPIPPVAPVTPAVPAEPVVRKQLVGHRATISVLAFSPNGRLLAGGGQGSVCVWDMPAGTLRYAVPVPADRSYHAVAFSTDGRTLLAAPDHPDAPAPIALYDADTGAPDGRLEGHEKGVFELSFSPDGKTLVSSGWEGELRFWDFARRELVRTVPVPNMRWVRAGVFSNRGQLGVGCGKIYLLDGQGGFVRAFDADAAPLAFSPDGSLLLGSVWREGVATLWDVDAGEEVAAWKAHEGKINVVAFSAGGGVLATAGQGGVRLWGAGDRRQLGELEHAGEAYGVAFAPDRRHVVTSGTDKTVKVWDVSGILARDTPPAARP